MKLARAAPNCGSCWRRRVLSAPSATCAVSSRACTGWSATSWTPAHFFVALGSWEQGQMTLPYCVDHYRLVEGGGPIPLEGSLTGHVFREGSPVVVRNAEDWRRYPWIERGEGDDVLSALAVPRRIGASTIGVICAQSLRPYAY